MRGRAGLSPGGAPCLARPAPLHAHLRRHPSRGRPRPTRAPAVPVCGAQACGRGQGAGAERGGLRGSEPDGRWPRQPGPPRAPPPQTPRPRKRADRRTPRTWQRWSREAEPPGLLPSSPLFCPLGCPQTQPSARAPEGEQQPGAPQKSSTWDPRGRGSHGNERGSSRLRGRARHGGNRSFRAATRRPKARTRDGARAARWVPRRRGRFPHYAQAERCRRRRGRGGLKGSYSWQPRL